MTVLTWNRIALPTNVLHLICGYGRKLVMIHDKIRSPEEALWVADALSAQLQQLRQSLDHRSIFSMGYNRKLAKKIELLDQIREDYLILSRDLHQQRQEARKNDGNAS